MRICRFFRPRGQKNGDWFRIENLKYIYKHAHRDNIKLKLGIATLYSLCYNVLTR